MVGNTTICNIKLIEGRSHELMLGLGGIGYWVCIPVEGVGKASIRWTVSDVTGTALHEEFPRVKSRSETRGKRSFRLQ